MKIIEKLSNMIDDEIEDACNYAKLAIKYKDENPALAQTFYDLSTDEYRHGAVVLHEQVVNIIKQYNKEHGEPPVVMKAVYDYLHEKQIEKANMAKMYQDQYKNK